VREAGGRFVFVIVPDARMFRRAPAAGHEPSRHLEKLTAGIRALGIPVVDLSAAIGGAPDPMALYEPLGGYYGHFNPAGYALAARALEQGLAGL
jgi:lysophospholipase L1-like esterase